MGGGFRNLFSWHQLSVGCSVLLSQPERQEASLPATFWAQGPIRDPLRSLSPPVPVHQQGNVIGEAEGRDCPSALGWWVRAGVVSTAPEA